MEVYFLYFFSLLAIGGALYLLFSKNVLYAAFGLLVCLLAVGGMFIVLGAEYVGVSQLMVYAGGIIVLVLFAIMLSSKGGQDKNFLVLSNQNFIQYGLSLFVAGILFVLFISKFPLIGTTTNNTDLTTIGKSILVDYVLVLELLGLLLLMALVGATYLAKKRN